MSANQKENAANNIIVVDKNEKSFVQKHQKKMIISASVIGAAVGGFFGWKYFKAIPVAVETV